MGGIFGGGGGSKGPSQAEKDAVARREKKAEAAEANERRSIASRRNAASKGNRLLMMTDRDNPGTGINAPDRMGAVGRNPRDMNAYLQFLQQQRKSKRLGGGND